MAALQCPSAVSQHAQDPETEAAKYDSAIIKFIYTDASPTVTCEKKGNQIGRLEIFSGCRKKVNHSL